MEDCKIVEGQRYTKRLNEKQITSLLKVTCQRPRAQEMYILQIFILITICLKKCTSVYPHTAHGFCQELAQMCQISGMEFQHEPVIPIYSARPEQSEKALKHVYNAAMNKLKGKELDLIIAILPDNNSSLYADL